MQILLGHRRADPRLEEWERRPFWPGVESGPGAEDRRDAYVREIAVEAPGPPEPGGAHRRVAERILAYEVFPPRWITGVLRRRPVEVGDTVGIRFHLMPGIDLFFAARVVSVLDGETGGTWSTGFTYQTLVGHPELGEETFSVEKDVASGRVSAALRSWSRPGTLLAKAFAPLVRVFQVRASRAALDHLSAVALDASWETGADR